MADDLDRQAVRDLIPAYALDAVTDAEARAVESLVASDDAARRELDELRESVAAFVVDAAPSADVRADVLARVAALTAGTDAAATPVLGSAPSAAPIAAIGSTAGTADRASSDTAGPASSDMADDAPSNVVPIGARRRRNWLVAAAAAAIVAVAVPTGIAVQTHQTQVQLQAQVDRVAQMLADPDARLVTSPVAGGGEASALVADGDVLFTASGLPGTGEDEDYQLWIVADGAATSAGLFDADDPQALVEAAAGEVVAMTLEPAGGSDQPTSDPIVALQT
ncbi:anti-sigma-K factor rskA [Sediminihabitans luteus]|uniref:Regulator of SigK n=1 Tax=Sediminihabitans luteus TaxID=1138585 RepID=A0A2M9CEK4_9CELL|nr:anti-sigma factor [Sediminihabitans luteus]PJJ70323.1 anti-sigma-K factor rskA [Sediminihabitans luteus]GII97794.1 hypothetical protein Slu03_01720 [Sediminihabitans luteus]